MTEEKRICADCVQDPYLSAEISRSEEDEVTCDYCERIAPTLSISEVAIACDEIIEAYFTLTSDSAAVVYHGRTPKGQSLIEILDMWLTPDDQTAAYDVAEVLEYRWTYEDDGRYGEDPWFVRQGSAWELSRDWEDMERSLREEARLVNPTVIETFEKVFGGLDSYRMEDGTGLIFEVGPGQQIQTLYRARVFEHRDALQRALENPEHELGPPAAAVASAGRMNSKGISVFYGALERRTALHEVRPPVGAAIAIAAFTLIRPLRLLNLSALTAARLDPSLSLFDPATRAIAQRCDFINSLEAELTKPVLPSFTDGGYLITQAIADYLATHRELNLDGIFFKSVQYHGTINESGGHNVILFHKAAAVKIPDVAKTSASLARQVGEDEWEGPSITTLPKEIDDNPAFHGTWPGTEREESLELQRDSIEIHRVSWVEVKTDVEMVEHKFAHPSKPSRHGAQE
jgi:hypothetical protein